MAAAAADGVPTPTELRSLAVQAEQLAAAVRALDQRLRGAPGEPTRRAGFLLDDTAGYLLAASGGLAATADDLVRIRGRCGADRGVCPRHGNTPGSSGGRAWCTTPGCDRSWGYDRGGLPCSEPASHTISDVEGGRTLLVRRPHPRRPSPPDRATIRPLNGSQP
jgi:hypothetical protein